jgi:phosphoglycolate phosphatase
LNEAVGRIEEIMMRRFRGVMFDLDGTLLDTLEGLGFATNVALEAMGFKGHPIEAYRYFVGDGVRAKAERALPEGYRDEAHIDRCVELAGVEYAKCWRGMTKLYDGIAELLTALTGAGVSMTVFSNKPDELTVLTVETMLGDWKFDAVRGQRDGAARKPDPQVAIEISGQLGISPGEMLYLGDTDTDMQTANKAGMYAVGALWGFRTREELLTNGAKALAARPMDVMGLL